MTLKLLSESQKNIKNHSLIDYAWEQLLLVKKLEFFACSQGPYKSGWDAEGIGEVIIKQQSSYVLNFEETGTWISKHQQEEFTFKNAFRWVKDPYNQVISLEHLRFGIERPVFLFQLAPKEENTLQSVSSYLCGKDAYWGKLTCFPSHIALNWWVVGPKKNEAIHYIYKTENFHSQ